MPLAVKREESLPDVFKDVDFDPEFEHFSNSFKKRNLTWKNINLKLNKNYILKDGTGHVESGAVYGSVLCFVQFLCDFLW